MTTFEATAAPSALSAYGRAWPRLWEQIGRFLLVFLIFAAFQIPSTFDLGGAGSLLIVLYQLVIVGPLTFGLYWVYLVAARGGRVEVSDLFVPLQRFFGTCIATNVLLSVLFTAASLPLVGAVAYAAFGSSPVLALALCVAAFFLPFFVAIRLLFVPYAIVDEGCGPVEAMRRSWERTGPIFGQLVVFGLVAMALTALGFLALVVGAIFAVMWSALALATLYADVADEPLPPEAEPLRT